MIGALHTRLILAGVFLLFVVAGCTNSENQSGDHQDIDKPLVSSVQHFGPMREVMREGETQARVRLSDAIAKPHAFAVGALERLAGEVTIIDSDVWVSRVASDGTLSVTGPQPADDDAATLMSISYVAKWHAIKIESACAGNELESLIEEFAVTVHGVPIDHNILWSNRKQAQQQSRMQNLRFASTHFLLCLLALLNHNFSKPVNGYNLREQWGSILICLFHSKSRAN